MRPQRRTVRVNRPKRLERHTLGCRLRSLCGNAHYCIFAQGATMLRRLVGWTKVVCACSVLWVVPYSLPAQEVQRPTVTGVQTAESASFLTTPDTPSQRALKTSLPDDQSDRGTVSSLLAGIRWKWERVFIATVAMLGAVLLSLPLALAYVRTRPPTEFDSSVLFSIVFLAATIAGILVVVQGSVARALSLAGVVSAVRFRSSLKDSNDAVYILGAIAVGLAAGSNELDVGLVISVLLTITLIVLWKVRLDAVDKMLLPSYTESKHGHHNHDLDFPPSVARAASSVTRAAPSVAHLALSDTHAAPSEVHAAPSDVHSPPSEAHSAPSDAHTAHTATNSTPSEASEGDGIGLSSIPDLNAPVMPRIGYIILETEHLEQTRLLVETFLERETKAWRLDSVSGNGLGYRERHKHESGVVTLTYRVRFRKSSQPDAIIERLKAVGHSSNFSVRLQPSIEVADRVV